MKRREVRQVVVQTLYQMISAHKDLDINEAVAYALEAGVFPEEGYEGIDNEYFYELIEGVRSKETEIDKLIEPYLTGWSLDRIARTPGQADRHWRGVRQRSLRAHRLRG